MMYPINIPEPGNLWVLSENIIKEAFEICSYGYTSEYDLNKYLGKIKALRDLQIISIDSEEEIVHELVHIYDHRNDGKLTGTV